MLVAGSEQVYLIWWDAQGITQVTKSMTVISTNNLIRLWPHPRLYACWSWVHWIAKCKDAGKLAAPLSRLISFRHSFIPSASTVVTGAIWSYCVWGLE